jgi:transcriptional regulator GlxA family with amidase domain
MAKAAGTSVRGLERAFLRDYGLSPQQYLRRLRMQTACQLLVSSSLALAQVADRCGFADQSHFTRDFRSLTGVTPRAYRLAFAS